MDVPVWMIASLLKVLRDSVIRVKRNLLLLTAVRMADTASFEDQRLNLHTLRLLDTGIGSPVACDGLLLRFLGSDYWFRLQWPWHTGESRDQIFGRRQHMSRRRVLEVNLRHRPKIAETNGN